MHSPFSFFRRKKKNFRRILCSSLCPETGAHGPLTASLIQMLNHYQERRHACDDPLVEALARLRGIVERLERLLPDAEEEEGGPRDLHRKRPRLEEPFASIGAAAAASVSEQLRSDFLFRHCLPTAPALPSGAAVHAPVPE